MIADSDEKPAVGAENPVNMNEQVASGVVVYFDGSCPLCSREIKHYASCRGGDTIKFVDASVAGADLGPDLQADVAMSRFHVRRQDGTLASGATAFAVIWNTLPGWRWVARIARFKPAGILLEAAYRSFLPARNVLSALAVRFGFGPVGTGGIQNRSGKH